MLENITSADQLKFQDISAEEKQSRGILGRLSGPIASFIKSTRNGRLYKLPLWEKVFQNPIVKELFKAGGLPGELSHPVDRAETDPEKIAIMMHEMPKKDKDGHLVATVDILDTPCGKIAYALAKYGFKFGISSRGDGELVTDFDGNSVVDEDTYNLNAFDLVLIPACEDARLTFTEALNNNQSLHETLTRYLDKAVDNEKQIMQEKLDELHIDYPHESGDNIDRVSETESDEADNDGEHLVKELQEALKRNAEYETLVTKLQEKLSVRYTKETAYIEKLQKYENSIQSLTEDNKNLKSQLKKIDVLNGQLKGKNSEITDKQEDITSLQSRYKDISKKYNTKCNESLEYQKDIKELKSQIVSLNEQLNSQKNESEQRVNTLVEQVEELKSDKLIKQKEYQKKLSHSNSLVEKYQKIAQKAVDKYIEHRAVMLGVTPIEIKNRLNENYSFADIDNVCTSLQSYKVNMSKLPFSFNKPLEPVNIRRAELTESKKTNSDDFVDSQLLELAGLN